MVMPSARRSSRSTVRTTSAASDDAVETAGADGHAHVGQGEGGGVVDAVAHHDRRPVPGGVGDGVDLLGRRSFGQDHVDADDGADRLGDVRPVAGDHLDPLDAAAAQGPDGPGRIGAEGVLEHDRARGLAVHPDEDGERAVQVGRRRTARTQRGGASVGQDPPGLPGRDPVTVDDPTDTVRRNLLHIGRAGPTRGRAAVRRGRRPRRARAGRAVPARPCTGAARRC